MYDHLCVCDCLCVSISLCAATSTCVTRTATIFLQSYMSGGDYDDVEELEEKLEAYKRTCVRAKGTCLKSGLCPHYVAFWSWLNCS